MNDENIFDRNYCINSAQTKEIMVHYILQPRYIFICVKVSFLCSFQAEISYSILYVAHALRGARSRALINAVY